MVRNWSTLIYKNNQIMWQQQAGAFYWGAGHSTKANKFFVKKPAENLHNLTLLTIFASTWVLKKEN
jgi:hypothetical protein